ncbi:hypothetical protein GCM10023160_18790 [Brachybacterium paraconglomeratum]|uniref:hypothetical protein n=1 Tax=Brachybacterium paraconglomeratum TaxID=173362 RepID=UPI0031EE8AD3
MTASTLDRLYTLRQLQDAGYGDRITLTKRIHRDEIPAVKVGNRYMVYESDLRRLVQPVNDVAGKPSAASPLAEDLDDLAALAARMVATWPRLSDDRKRELGALLATP